MPNALKRMKSQQKLSKKASPAEAAAEAADKELAEKVEPPARTKKGTEIPDTTGENGTRRDISIRGIIITMLKANKSTKEITDVVRDKFPKSAAAKKPSKHIAFYRAKLKKEANAE